MMKLNYLSYIFNNIKYSIFCIDELALSADHCVSDDHELLRMALPQDLRKIQELRIIEK